jgi:hypothetical protein
MNVARCVNLGKSRVLKSEAEGEITTYMRMNKKITTRSWRGSKSLRISPVVLPPGDKMVVPGRTFLINHPCSLESFRSLESVGTNKRGQIQTQLATILRHLFK